MAETQALAKLHDIHLPELIGWWPLAPGWYLLLLIALLVLGLIIYWVHRSHKHRRAKLQALVLLQGYEQEYQDEANSQQSSMKVSELLRRVALAYYPREEVASLQGEAWLNFLTKTSKGIDFNTLSNYLLALPYQPSKPVDLGPLFDNARRWIKQRGVPCSN
ncbi:hypothetical protein BN59_00268 [Legionella massiliensis]|uniref:DUF4381 domain-containing protein n=1 Tax=Legionella massiliensis TaxID=1034943 RepID=A0A078KW75_9GAMM|nr:DUF4381 domain-containing protein [Legionella massiliensis]CDZ76004.1 hypothetical protein BN59_00268 [Legionella massiliensis]CEE11742.1 hypothetical protein BN1094_00268 [Legionella massiliensis]